MQNEKVLASEKPVSYFQEEQDNQAKLMAFYQRNLIVKFTKNQRSTDYIFVYGTVTNNNPVSIKGVSIKVAAYNAAKEIVSDGVGYVVSGQYLKPDQTGYFKVMLSDQSQEITSIDATVEPVYAFSVAQ